LRLGVGVFGSIPNWLILPLAFVVLVVVRSVSLVLGVNKPDDRNSKNERGGGMKTARGWLSVFLETTWAVGGSVLAGLPLLT
jgi:hypothetical protein